MNRKLLATALVVILVVAGLWVWKQGYLRLPLGAPAGWSRTYGGDNNDEVKSALGLGEEGFLVAGGTFSFGAGDQDGWLMKLDQSGRPLWEKAFGGADSEEFLALAKAADQGYILAGRVRSFGAGGMDAWVLKLDARLQPAWQEAIGGPEYDYAAAIAPLSQGGYLAVGASGSSGAGYADLWALKLDAGGKVIWQKTYGGDQWDYGASLAPTPEGGCIVVGGTQSFGAKLTDAWALRLDPDGQVLWQKLYGGDQEDRFYSIIETADHNYLIAGGTASFGAGQMDVWVLKLDPHGQVLWQKTYGGKGDDRAFSVQAVSDGGYLVLAHTQSFGAGLTDAWLLKLDAQGQLQWQKTYGGKMEDRIYGSLETPDHGFLVAGGTASFGAGKADAWVFKLAADGSMSKDCPAGVSTALVGVSAARVKDTAATVADSKATVIANTPTPMPTHAALHSQCPPEKVEAAKKPAPEQAPPAPRQVLPVPAPTPPAPAPLAPAPGPAPSVPGPKPGGTR